jgi:hypothetical protein
VFACHIERGCKYRKKTQQKTPPPGEEGGEKQYKDYEKNPYLVFSMP